MAALLVIGELPVLIAMGFGMKCDNLLILCNLSRGTEDTQIVLSAQPAGCNHDTSVRAGSPRAHMLQREQ